MRATAVALVLLRCAWLATAEGSFAMMRTDQSSTVCRLDLMARDFIVKTNASESGRPSYTCDDGQTVRHEHDAWTWHTATGVALRIQSYAVAPFLIASSSPKLRLDRLGLAAILEDERRLGVVRVMNMGSDGFYVMRGRVTHTEACGEALMYRHVVDSRKVAWTCATANGQMFFSSTPGDVAVAPRGHFACTLVPPNRGSCVRNQVPVVNGRVVVARAEADVFEASIESREHDWRERAQASTPVSVLSNGLVVPLIGLGTGGLHPEETTVSVRAALQAGYALVDSAAAYQNEKQIGALVKHGEALGERVAAAGANACWTRAPAVITKVWPTELGFARTLASARESARKLNPAGAMDVLLLHWPRCYADIEWMDCDSADADDDEDAPLWLESWRALEMLYAQGEVLAIGVSNFDAKLLEAAVERAAHVEPMRSSCRSRLCTCSADASPPPAAKYVSGSKFSHVGHFERRARVLIAEWCVR